MKIIKALSCQEEALTSTQKEMKESAKVLGLKKNTVSEFKTGLILEFDGGDTEYHIEYGIERLKDFHNKIK